MDNSTVPTPVTQAAQCSVSLIESTNPDRLAKKFSLADGSLQKEPGGYLIRGHYKRVSADTADQFAALIDSLKANQALNFGTAGGRPMPIATKKSVQPGEIARSQAYFDWPTGTGWLMIDYDPAEDAEPLRPFEVMGAIDDALSAEPLESPSSILRAPVVTVDSGSSWIYHGDECLKGRGGCRWYIQIQDATDIERAGAALFDRLWLAGYGYYAVSACGSGLKRTIIDGAVYTPERLDFAAGAATVGPLDQKRDEAAAFNSEAAPLDTRAAIPDLTDDERQRIEFLQACAYNATEPKRRAAREAWLSENTDKRLQGVSDRSVANRRRIRRELERSLDGGVLRGDYALRRQDGTWTTVQELIDDPNEFDREQFFDPLEPDYNNNATVAVAYLDDGRPRIWSQAHGGRMFKLEPDPTPWLAGWHYVRGDDKFYNAFTGQKASKQAFNLENGKHIPLNKRGTAKVAQPAEYAADYCELPFVDKVVYAPQFAETFEMGGLSCLNAFRHDSLPIAAVDHELTAADHEAVQAVDRHLWMICDEDRSKYQMLRDWLAFNAQNPGRKIRWVPLIKGIEGDGKSRLFDVLGAALGGDNLSVVGPKVLMSDFNGFAEGSCAVALEEIRMEGHSRFDAVNALKAAITNDTIEIHRKGVDSYNVPNSTNYIAFTNHSDAVPIHDTDRRWSPIFTPWESQHEFEQRIGEAAASYFAGLSRAIERHAPALCHWLRTVAISDSFEPDGRAPDTPEKRVMRDQGEDDDVQLVRETIEAGGCGIGGSVLSMRHLSETFKGLGLQGEDVPSSRRAAEILKRLGWMKYPDKIRWNGKICPVWYRGAAPRGADDARARLDETGQL